MSLKSYLHIAKRFTLDNSPTICTGIAVVGTVSTSVLTALATFKAADTIFGHEVEFGTAETTNKVRASLIWKYYIPPFIVGAATIGCIIGSNNISGRRNAALVAAATMGEKAFDEYKTKVIQTMGEKSHQKIVDEIAADHIRENPPSEAQLKATSDGKTLCYESYTGRYFYNDMESIRKAENDVNAQILSEDYASQNDFFRRIGLPTISSGEEVGWTTSSRLEVQYSSILSESGTPALHLGYTVLPVRDYNIFG